MALTNYCLNPYFDTSYTTDWGNTVGDGTVSLASDQYRSLPNSCKIVAGTAATNWRTTTGMTSLADGHEVMFRMWMRCGAAPTGNKAYAYIRDVTNAVNVDTVYATLTNTWELIYGSWINDTGGTVLIRLHAFNAFNDSSTAIWFDDCVLAETGGIYILRKVMGVPDPTAYILSGKRE